MDDAATVMANEAIHNALIGSLVTIYDAKGSAWFNQVVLDVYTVRVAPVESYTINGNDTGASYEMHERWTFQYPYGS